MNFLIKIIILRVHVKKGLTILKSVSERVGSWLHTEMLGLWGGGDGDTDDTFLQ